MCTIHLRTQCLCLQSQVLLRILQTIVTPRSMHVDEISHMDVALLDCVLGGCLINLGYIVIRHMLSILGMVNRSLLYGSFITRMLKFFQVP